MNFQFTKAEHLTRKKEFERVFNEGMVIKKVGNSPRRNRAKRLLREAYRLNKHLLKTHVDIIAIPRHPFSSDLKLSDIEEEFKKLLLQINRTFSQNYLIQK